MKKLLFLSLFFLSLSCSETEEVKPKEVKLKSETPPPNGECLPGSPAGYCCLYSGASYQCNKIQ